MSNLVLERRGGLGDVLMLLGAAKALKNIGNVITINTDPRYLAPVSQCPHIRSMMTEVGHGIELGSVQFGAAQKHQIDAYLEYFGFTDVPAEDKQIEYDYPQIVLQGIGDYVLVHPGVYSSGNRGWNQPYWQRVIDALAKDGHKVVVIGSHTHIGLPMGEYQNIAGTVLCDNILETTGIIANAKALVSIDSGPIQMAGATDTPIVGLYSVTKPEFRSPFRNNECGWKFIGLTAPCDHHPCYKGIMNEEVWKDVKQVDDVNTLFANFCPEGNYACLEVKPSLIVESVNNLLEAR